MPETRIPTLNDLRVKLCYICREEERFDAVADASSPPRRWTHPCKCTLIAHETCLLKWIQTAQADSRRSQNALKCPQCGAEYELASRHGRFFMIISAANRTLVQAGRLFTVGAIAGCAVLFGAGVYVVLTGYGAYALEQFIGKEMFDLLLTDDPANWPWGAYLNLPCITLSLIVSRLQPGTAHALLVPLLLIWPHAVPVSSRSDSIDENSQRSGNEHWFSFRRSAWKPKTAMAQNVLLPRWPPSPFICSLILFPLMRAVYTRVFARLQAWLLGAPPPRPQESGWQWRLGMIRIRMQEEQRQERVVREGQGGGQGEGQGEGQGDGRVQEHDALRVAFDAEMNARAANNHAQRQPLQGQNAQLIVDDDDPATAVAAAEHLVETESTSFGRQVAGALLVPAIAGKMGAFLLQLSLSRRAGIVAIWLRQFLGIRIEKLSGTTASAATLSPAANSSWWGNIFGSGGGGARSWFGLSSAPAPSPARSPVPPLSLALGPWASGHHWEKLGLAQQIRLGLRLMLGLTWNGTRAWAESDPVWWRNTIGMGVFLVAKDCLRLLYVFLTKSELESRHVRNRDFASVDMKELDLVPSFPRPDSEPNTALNGNVNPIHIVDADRQGDAHQDANVEGAV